MPVLQFKGKTAIECYHHTLEFDAKLSVLGKGEKPGLDGNLIIVGEDSQSKEPSRDEKRVNPMMTGAAMEKRIKA